MIKLLAFLVGLFSGLGTMYAQAVETERILLPTVANQPVRGAFGSLWQTKLKILNASSTRVAVSGIDTACRIPPCFAAVLEPESTISAIPTLGQDSGVSVLMVPRGRASDLRVHLRVQDLSRQSQTWGTEIPVVRETDALTGRHDLLDIPLETNFRTTIRIYDFNPVHNEPREIRLRFFRIVPERQYDHQQVVDEFLAEARFRLPLLGQPELGLPGFTSIPLSTVQGLPTSGIVRVELTPLSGDLRYWAYASITNNETQHVTIVTPNHH